MRFTLRIGLGFVTVFPFYLLRSRAHPKFNLTPDRNFTFHICRSRQIASTDLANRVRASALLEHKKEITRIFHVSFPTSACGKFVIVKTVDKKMSLSQSSRCKLTLIAVESAIVVRFACLSRSQRLPIVVRMCAWAANIRSCIYAC